VFALLSSGQLFLAAFLTLLLFLTFLHSLWSTTRHNWLLRKENKQEQPPSGI
jgi:hypothetical protein